MGKWLLLSLGPKVVSLKLITFDWLFHNIQIQNEFGHNQEGS